MQFLPYIQLALAILTIVLVLVQERSSGGSSLLGNGSDGTYQARRGIERVIFFATIVSTVAFAALSLAQLYFGRY